MGHRDERGIIVRSRTRKIIGAVSATVLAVTVSIFGDVGAASAATPGLSGEYSSGFAIADTWDVQCDVTGTSTLTFTASGPVSGPYPGTLTEQGTVTFSPPFVPRDYLGGASAAQLDSFDVTFHIDSPAGQITGTKHLTGNEEIAVGLCGPFMPQPNPDSGYARAYGMAYEAEITTPDGEHYSDSGRANAEASLVPTSQGTASADEDWVSSNGVVLESPPPPASVTLTPAAATNPVGTSHTVTATVRDDAGDPVASSTVLFTVTGSTSTTGSCTTDASGACSFSYQGPDLPGADDITACADANNNGTVDTAEPCGEATKAWLLTATTPGQVTGGGQVDASGGNGQAAFGFNAKSDGTDVNGNCTVVDPAADIKVKCLDVTTLTQAGTHATLFGHADVNGVDTTYRIDVDDLGEPGAGSDTFKIHTASGYLAGGVLRHGNVQIH